MLPSNPQKVQILWKQGRTGLLGPAGLGHAPSSVSKYECSCFLFLFLFFVLESELCLHSGPSWISNLITVSHRPSFSYASTNLNGALSIQLHILGSLSVCLSSPFLCLSPSFWRALIFVGNMVERR